MPPNTAVPSERRAAELAPVAITSGSHAQDERERRHQNRPQPQVRRFDRRIADRLACSWLSARELHDQNRVLRRQADQRHDADLRVDVVRDTTRRQTAASAPNMPSGSANSTANGIDQLS